MAFRNANHFGYNITLPFGKHSYLIPSPPVDVGNFMVETTQLTGKRIALLAQLDGLTEDDPERKDIERQLEDVTDVLTIPDEVEGDYFRAVLGPAYDEMTTNREPFELVKLAAATVSVWVLQGREEAEAFWNAGGRHPSPRRAPQDRKRAKRGPSQNAGTSK